MKPNLKWIEKHKGEMWWGPCGFVIVTENGQFPYRLLVNGKVIQLCRTLKSAKDYCASFMQQCADALAADAEARSGKY